MDTIIVIAAVAVLVVLGLGAWAYMNSKRSERLREQFGPEYEVAVAEHGKRGEAEKELAAREKRVEELNIRPLEAGQRKEFHERWTSVQAQFVDDPAGAIHDADDLVGEVMGARGYPVSDFDQRTADISVKHPGVVKNYRQAHNISLANDRGEADTEGLRQAMVHYRELFEELLVEGSDTEARPREEARR